LMGTLGGIGELAKEVFGEGSAKTPTEAKPEKKSGRASLPGVPRVEG